MRIFVQAQQRTLGQDHRIGDANAGRYASSRLLSYQLPIPACKKKRNALLWNEAPLKKKHATKTVGCGRQLDGQRSNSHEVANITQCWPWYQNVV